MIFSVHIAEVGPRAAARVLTRPPRVGRVAGLTYAETTTTAPLGAPLLPPRDAGRLGLLAAWRDDASLDAFERDHPVARHLASGWRVRLQPLRVFGSWAGLTGLPARALPVDAEEPVAILTLGRLRLRRLRAFRRTAALAEADAVAHPALLAGTGLARPPRLVATFSLWRGAGAMREYAVGASGSHAAALRADRAHPFHRESAFIRFRPYASGGSWEGHDPLAGLLIS